ncbi:hypothetical protein [Oleiagrimonas sp. C23AA]|uniref:hypothetical protein n=1 Tax=Oleiagrimonas sp. C23AA TaxID=2719047 RepID=UPI001422BBD5|nr:hypothetical protein [Oleiagrimonas sp. C23AA]NII09069.1 hypothetical protein [Oleiagrimonas sp. C23AA]
MRQIYTSPRHANIDRVVALMNEHGIETSVANRAVYRRQSYNRFSYNAAWDSRSDWPVVEVVKAADLTPARKLLKEIGIEPATRHAEILEAMRLREQGVVSPADKRRSVVRRARTIVFVAVLAALVVMGLKAMQIF